MPETLTPLPAGFSRCMVDWQRQHGRQSLPWQNTQDPYRVWLSEIMLQQTQVTTVLDYFPRFLGRFADVAALAAAQQDDVLALWSGLGYYSRARNLHKCAQEVMGRFGGVFPQRAEDLQTLPGIGRSTAAAIAAFCFQERSAILDGNVKRVLTRVLGYGQDLAVAKNERALWSLAQDLLPEQASDMPRYTQALMDLGATVCLPRKVQCDVCPVSDLCRARGQGEPLAYPVKTRKIKRCFGRSTRKARCGCKSGPIQAFGQAYSACRCLIRKVICVLPGQMGKSLSTSSRGSMCSRTETFTCILC
jgi:A/G-specific adenine glycosylase